MMDPITLMQPELAFEESLEKIFNWIEEKRYFQVRDELLKYNEADIAEMFEELLEDSDLIEAHFFLLTINLPLKLRL